MTKKVFINVVSFRNFRYFFLTTFVIFGCYANVWSQNQVAATDSSSKDSEVKSKDPEVKKEAEKPAQPVSSKSQMKVTFDENSPGVIFIESK
ncbi:MAG: hypothetical protein ABJA66_14655, partial [Actinomycetota bacterium]